MSDAAEILYGSEAPAAPAPKSNDPAAVLYRSEKPEEQPKPPAPLDLDKLEKKPAEPKSPEAVDRVAEVIARDLGLDPQHELTGEFSKTAAELGLSTEQTKKLTALHGKHSETFWNGVWDGWAAEAQKIPPAEIQHARNFVRDFGSPELNKLLDEYKLGDNPHLIRAFAKASAARGN